MPFRRRYYLPIAVRQTAATASTAVVWEILNPPSSLRRVHLRRLFVNVMFDGTSAASQSQYQLSRFRSTTPAAGSAQTVVKQIVSDATVGKDSVVTSRFLDTGLTVAGIAVDAPGASFGAPRTQGASCQYNMDYPAAEAVGDTLKGQLVLEPGDGLALVLGVAAVIGDGIQGWVEWDEMGGASG